MAESPDKVRHGVVRTFAVGAGLPSIPKMMEELQDMTDVLLGRADPPINHGPLTLQVTADAYYARAAEMTMLIQHMEREGQVMRNSNLYKFRTGELRTFMEMAKRASELGSRYLTYEQLLFQKEIYGRESKGRPDV